MLNFAKYTSRKRLFLAVLFSLLPASGLESVAVGDLLKAPKRTANYSTQSRNHVHTHGHSAGQQPVRLPNGNYKSRFRPTEGGQKFTDEVLNHPNVRITHQGNGRIKYEVDDLGRNVGFNQSNLPTRGGIIIVEGPSPATWSTYAPGEVVTQFPF